MSATVNVISTSRWRIPLALTSKEETEMPKASTRKNRPETYFLKDNLEALSFSNFKVLMILIELRLHIHNYMTPRVISEWKNSLWS